MNRLSQSQIIRPADLARRIGVSRVTLWRWEREGNLPKRTRLGPHSVGWLESEIDAWWQDRARSASLDRKADAEPHDWKD